MPSQPETFAAFEEWGPWVLEMGLPPLPPTVRVGEVVPVARFVGPEYGAVAVVSRIADEDGDDAIEFDVEVYHREGTEWVAAEVGGGTNWHTEDEPLLRRCDFPSGQEVVFAFELGGSNPDGRFSAILGFAGTAAALVQVTGPGEHVTQQLDWGCCRIR